MKPSSTPQASRALVLSVLKREWKKHIKEPFPDFVVAFIRGYYFRTMGHPSKNDRGIYDDGAFVIGPDTFTSFNANADPSAFCKGVATIMPGFYPFRPGNHGISRPGGGYPAFRPATPGEKLPVFRDGEIGRSKRDGVATNIHRGGYTTTSSEGCLTLYPTQWEAFHALVHMELRKVGLKRFWVGVIDGPIN